jgi:hypothetical protein
MATPNYDQQYKNSLRTAIKNSLRTQPLDEETRRAIRNSLITNTNEEDIRKAIRLSKQPHENAKKQTSRLNTRLSDARKMDNNIWGRNKGINQRLHDARRLDNLLNGEDPIQDEQNAVKQILEEFPRSKHIQISGKNNDCLYNAVAKAFFLGDELQVSEFKTIYIQTFINEQNDTINFFFRNTIVNDVGGDTKIAELNACKTLGEYVKKLQEHIWDNRMASDVEAGIMSTYIKEFRKEILMGTAQHILNRITQRTNTPEWKALVVNCGLHYDVIIKDGTRDGGGTTKSMPYRDLQRLARAHGLKSLTRPAATLKRAIAYQKGRAIKTGGDGGETCSHPEGCGCENAAMKNYIFLKHLEGELAVAAEGAAS